MTEPSAGYSQNWIMCPQCQLKLWSLAGEEEQAAAADDMLDHIRRFHCWQIDQSSARWKAAREILALAQTGGPT